MSAATGLAVVIPARDEARLLPHVLAAIPAAVERVVLVDDGSRDGTWAVMRAWRDPRALRLRLWPARGVGAALRAGYREALAAGATVVAVVAGDAQMDLADLPGVVAPVTRDAADYVQGNRFDGGRPRGPMPPTRCLGNRLLSAVTAWASGAPVGDSQCGFTAASAAFLEAVDWRRVPAGYGFPAFLRIEAHRLGARVVEVPVRAVYGDEASGIHPLRDPPSICARVLWRGVQRRLGLAGRARLGLAAWRPRRAGTAG